MCMDNDAGNPDRRRFMVRSAWAIAGLLGYAAHVHGEDPRPRSLGLHNLHTGETLDVTYWENGDYVPDALNAINHVLRDHRSNEVHPIDIRLLDTLNRLRQRLGFNGHYEVISGYRSPATNEMLRRKGRAVARRSMHMEGKAIDIRAPGLDLRHVHTKARNLEAGGVGYYTRSGFIHLDVGPVRTW